MRLCLFEDRFVAAFEPLVLTRPVFSLCCGLGTLGDKIRRHVKLTEQGALVRPNLVDVCRQELPFLKINDLDWLRAERTVLVNGRWIPSLEPLNFTGEPHVGLVGSQIAYVVVTPQMLTYCSPNTLDDCLQTWKERLPNEPAGGRLITHPWQLLGCLGDEMHKDLAWRTLPEDRGFHSSDLTLTGPSEELYVHETAEIEPWVFADTRGGPVVIDREAKVEAFSRLEGPCYVGPRAIIQGAKVRGSYIGPVSQIGGEVSHSILQGFVSKEHEGYLGWSYLGAWTHLSAGVEICDRRLDYQPISVRQRGGLVDSGCRRFGMCLGDHSQIGTGGIVNAGSLIGAFCDLFPQGELFPRQIPSFSEVRHGRLQPLADLLGRFQTAAELMALRGWSLAPMQEALYRSVHEQTARERRLLTHNWGELYLRGAA